MKKIYILIITLTTVTISLQSQCYPDRHNTTWYDGWISCNPTQNPNPDRGVSHWILYNLGEVYKLRDSKIWNSNDPSNLDRGLKQVAIDYSMDGMNWETLGTFDWEMAPGKSIYEGFAGPDFGGIETQFVLITALQNYGGNCYGLSEVKFGYDPEFSQTSSTRVPSLNHCLSMLVYPNPFVLNPEIEIRANCKEKLFVSVSDALGNTLFRQPLAESGVFSQKINLEAYPAGIYFLDVGNGVSSQKQKLVKLE